MEIWAALLIAAQMTACHRGSSPSARRLFFNSVNAGSAELLFQPNFERYADAMRAAGRQNLHVLGQLRERCFQCAPGGRFEKPAVRAALLDFVTAAVTQFRARYGDAIRYFGSAADRSASRRRRCPPRLRCSHFR